MERHETMEQLKFLYDQVHQTAEREEHLQERMPVHVEARSLNYEKDLTRIKGEYNRLVRTALEEGILRTEDLRQNHLPERWERG